MIKWIAGLAVLMTFTFAIPQAFAHSTSISYINLGIEESKVTGHWRIPLQDLDINLDLDINGDQRITWLEVTSAKQRIERFIQANFAIRQDRQTCPIKTQALQLENLSAGLYLYSDFTSECPEPQNKAPLTVDYQLFFNNDPWHRALLSWQQDNISREVIFSPRLSSHRLTHPIQLDHDNHSFLQFLVEGIWHIWIGIDHIAFLIALLIPCVRLYPPGQQQAIVPLTRVLKDVFSVVTAFTLAHSITLCMATLQWISLPSHWVEATIAFSVSISAIIVFIPKLYPYRWLIAFGFGLIHGFGFASVLAEQPLSASHFVANMLAFNLGVEIGQLVIVGAVVPLLFFIRNHWLYLRITLPVCSSTLFCLGLFWFWARLP